MTEVLPFECDHEADCATNGWDYSKDCPACCELRERKRINAMEQALYDMWWHVVEHNKRQVPGVDMSGFERPLKELGVDVWEES